MKIYVVMSCWYAEIDCMGTFSTKEKAEKFVEEYVNRMGGKPTCKVEEFELE